MTRTVDSMIVEQMKRSEIARRAVIEEARPALSQCTIITVSREMGSAGTEIAKIVAERLEWSFWDSELVEAIAEDAHVRTRVVEYFDEKTVSDIDSLAHALAGDMEVGNFMYRRHLAHALLSIARIGHAVIVGRGANFLLSASLNVRIFASNEFRVRRLMNQSLTREQAEAMIRSSDHQREEFIRKTFNRDINDFRAYDLLLKTDGFGIERSSELVMDAVNVRCR